jgi:hypothetical protein
MILLKNPLPSFPLLWLRAFSDKPELVAVIQPSLGALLVAAVGFTTLLLPRLLATALTAVLLSSVTGTADPENHAAPIGPANSLTKSQLRSARSPFPEAGLDNGHRSWQVTSSLEVVVL